MNAVERWLLLLVGVLEAVVTSKNPHILYIVMDDQGYGDVGYTYETNDVKTPLLDKLAKEGLILERHYTAWMCTPTRASIMTGKYPISLGLQHDVFQPHTQECLNEKELLLPEVVRHNGYATHHVGKWHLGYARWSCMACMRGFDTSYGFVSGELHWMSHELYGYYDFYECSYNNEDGLNFQSLCEDQWIFSNDLYNKRAKQIIETHDRDTPLFLYLAMQSVHWPYFVPPKYYDCTDTDRCTMQAMLNAAEELLTDVISYLKEANMWDDTLLIYISDNGAPESEFNSNGQLKGHKNQLWEGGVRTVAFMYSVNQDIMPNRGSTSCYVHVSDWYSTIIAISGGWDAYTNTTGLGIPADLDTIDQSSYLLFNTGSCPRTEIMLHIDPVKRVAGYYKNQYKLLIGCQDCDVECAGSGFYPLNIESIDFDLIQLFDIFADPNELENISSHKQDVVDDLKADVIEYLSHQTPLQCQLETVVGSYPNEDVPIYLPWDYDKEYLPKSAPSKIL